MAETSSRGGDCGLGCRLKTLGDFVGCSERVIRKVPSVFFLGAIYAIWHQFCIDGSVSE